jgi:histidinol-phosphate aminotransferase
VPTQANFIYVELPIAGRQAFQQLMRQGVIIRPMPGNFIRVTIGTAPQNCKFIQALEKAGMD